MEYTDQAKKDNLAQTEIIKKMYTPAVLKRLDVGTNTDGKLVPLNGEGGGPGASYAPS